jgi:hypothetical protein
MTNDEFLTWLIEAEHHDRLNRRTERPVVGHGTRIGIVRSGSIAPAVGELVET